MDRYLVVSSDGHAGLHAADYRPYVDPKHRDAFDAALPIQIEATERMSDYPPNISSIASNAVCSSIATITPLPAARPSAFTTIGAPCSRI